MALYFLVPARSKPSSSKAHISAFALLHELSRIKCMSFEIAHARAPQQLPIDPHCWSTRRLTCINVLIQWSCGVLDIHKDITQRFESIPVNLRSIIWPVWPWIGHCTPGCQFNVTASHPPYHYALTGNTLPPDYCNLTFPFLFMSSGSISNEVLGLWKGNLYIHIFDHFSCLEGNPNLWLGYISFNIRWLDCY